MASEPSSSASRSVERLLAVRGAGVGAHERQLVVAAGLGALEQLAQPGSHVARSAARLPGAV